MAIKFLNQAQLKDQRVIARFDFNVPIKNGEIKDSSRIDLALPTIRYILEHGAKKLVLMSHLGRPKGKPSDEYSLEPVATYLADKLNTKVTLTQTPVDNGLVNLLNLNEIKIVLLENLRFDPGEESNDSEFAFKLSKYGNIYVNDAFGAAHRKHASVHEIHRHFKGRAYAGLLLQKEINSLSKITESYQRPYVGIIGGAKISDKIKTIQKLLTVVDNLLIGGAMAYPFLRAQNVHIGSSLCDESDVKLASSILKSDRGNKLKLPLDHIIADKPTSEGTQTSDVQIPPQMMGLDIGEKTSSEYEKIITQAKTIFWNGPMGFFENPAFSRGTFNIARYIASNTQAFSLVGGGDSVSAVNQSGVANKFSHISTGGGASLEFIERGELPGIQALKFGVN